MTGTTDLAGSAGELGEALGRSDAGSRTTSRLLLMYDLEVRPSLEPGGRPPAEVFDFGRLTDHVSRTDEQFLPCAVLTRATPDIDLGPQLAGSPLRHAAGRVVVVVTPRQDALLLVDLALDVARPAEVAAVLFATWRHRDEIAVDGVPIQAWLQQQLVSGPEPRPVSLVELGRNVHQCVFPGGALAEQLIAAGAREDAPAEIVDIVLRGTLDGSKGSPLGVRRPARLNNPSQTLVAHGRGVSVIAGWTEQLENSFALAALGVLNAVAAIHRVRLHAFRALNERRTPRSVGEGRELLTQLSNDLTELQLDLAFSVEAFADSILIPELVVDGFHSSLSEAWALSDGIANTSHIVDRVASAIRARRLLLEAANQEQAEERDKLFTTIIAIATVLALPPTLLLSFFGANVQDIDPGRSILDVGHYGVAYAAAWLPFVLIVAVAACLRRRVQARVPEVYRRGDPTPGGRRPVRDAGPYEPAPQPLAPEWNESAGTRAGTEAPEPAGTGFSPPSR